MPNLSLGTQISSHKSGWMSTARYPDNIDAVRHSIRRRLKKSLRRRSQELGLSRASLQRILKKDIQLYPYTIQINHKLTPALKNVY